MKKQFYFGLIMLLGITLFSACSTDDDGSLDNSLKIAQVQSVVKSGTWRITNFNDSGQDETSDFTGYNFTFARDGTLSASDGTTTLNGTWSVTNDSSDDNDIEFNIFFSIPTSNNFEDLNDDWGIVSTSATRIELIDDSDNNSSTDRLTFEKN